MGFELSTTSFTTLPFSHQGSQMSSTSPILTPFLLISIGNCEVRCGWELNFVGFLKPKKTYLEIVLGGYQVGYRLSSSSLTLMHGGLGI